MGSLESWIQIDNRQLLTNYIHNHISSVKENVGWQYLIPNAWITIKNETQPCCFIWVFCSGIVNEGMTNILLGLYRIYNGLMANICVIIGNKWNRISLPITLKWTSNIFSVFLQHIFSVFFYNIYSLLP